MQLGVHATPSLPLPSPQLPEIHRETSLAPVRSLLRWQVPQVVQESPHLEPAVRLCELMARQLEDRGYCGSAGKCHQKRWVLDMEKLLRIDGREPEQVARVLAWLDRGADDVALFWQTNVLSPAKLRLQWDRMSHQYRNLRRKQMGGKRSGLAAAAGVEDHLRRTLAEGRANLGLTRG
jgi:hypothetical protein